MWVWWRNILVHIWKILPLRYLPDLAPSVSSATLSFRPWVTAQQDRPTISLLLQLSPNRSGDCRHLGRIFTCSPGPQYRDWEIVVIVDGYDLTHIYVTVEDLLVAELSQDKLYW